MRLPRIAAHAVAGARALLRADPRIALDDWGRALNKVQSEPAPEPDPEPEPEHNRS